MEDEDVLVTSDGEEAEDDAGGDAQVAGLPPYVDGIIQGYSKQYGRVIGKKLVRAKDPSKDRDRLVVTYEDGQGKRKAVTFKIGKEARPADPSDKTDTGTPAETTIVESVEDVKAPAKPAAPTRVVRGPDGKNHIMERDPATGEFSIDRGLSSSQPPPEKPAPSAAKNWQPLTGPDGRVVALLDPATGDTVNVTQKDAKTYETKDGRIISIDPDGKTASDITPESPGDKMIPATAPKYVPDYTRPDGGLTEYNEALLQARRDGTINREQGLKLLQQAGALWEETAKHGKTLVDQQRGIYGDQLTQRGQDINEVESRRTAAGNVLGDAFADYKNFSGKLTAGDGGLAAQAFMDALDIGRENAAAWGGLNEVPGVDLPPAVQAVRDIKIGKDGSVTIKIPDPTPQTPLTPEDQAAQQQAAAGTGTPSGPTPNEKEDRVPSGSINQPTQNATDPGQNWTPGGGEMPIGPEGVPYNPTDEVNPNAVGTTNPAIEGTRAAAPQWRPDPRTIAELKAKGFADDEIEEALAGMSA